jgi:hypothetical protein
MFELIYCTTVQYVQTFTIEAVYQSVLKVGTCFKMIP